MSKIREEFEQVLNVISKAVGTTLELDHSNGGWRIIRQSNSRPIGPRMKPNDMRKFLDGMAEFADLQHVLKVERDWSVVQS